MSLLLDALKKAAQEKQHADAVETKTESDAGLSLHQEADSTQAGKQGRNEEPMALEEFELDYDVLSRPEAPLPDADQHDKSQYRQNDSTTDDQDPRITPTPSTVTDEALQQLIHKTNDEYKKSRMLIWAGVATAALIVLSISGLYFYSNMMDDIESMQRKHQIALANLKSKTKIEENLTSLAVVSEPENPVKQVSKPDLKNNKSSPGSAPESSTRQRTTQTLRVQRAEKRDPVSEALERGYQAYQNKDYDLSKREYQKALTVEPNNHDALLGVAAVSLQQNDVDSAREIYISLLERDPRDPHAHAGLANIAQTSGASLSETKLKQLIEYRPDDSHLQFALGNLYVQKKSWPEAQQAFFNAWKADASNPDYAYNLAVSLDQLGKHREAKVYYEDSLKLATGKNISFSPEAVKNRLAYLGSIQ